MRIYQLAALGALLAAAANADEIFTIDVSGGVYTFGAQGSSATPLSPDGYEFGVPGGGLLPPSGTVATISATTGFAVLGLTILRNDVFPSGERNDVATDVPPGIDTIAGFDRSGELIDVLQ